MQGRSQSALVIGQRHLVFLIGASGALAQIILLRELLVSFYGNELTIGVILACWMLNEAAGAWSFGMLIDRLKRPWLAVAVLQTVFIAGFIVSVYAARAFKAFSGIPFGSGTGISTVLWASCAILFPAAFSHGALFSSWCRLYSSEDQPPGVSISAVYRLETCGTIAGAALAALALGRLGSFQIAFIVGWTNLVLTAAMIRLPSGIKRSPLTAALLLALAVTLSVFSAQGLENGSLARQYAPGEVLEYRNSPYGNTAVVRTGTQKTFFYNGLPAAIDPYPDLASVEDFAHIPLLMHAAPSRVLVIGRGAGGLLSEIVKHPVSGIDYLELDPVYISLFIRHASKTLASELSDSRVRVLYRDARDFLARTRPVYDVIFIGSSMPHDLLTVRLFSREFFSLCRQALRPKGILALGLAGSASYITPQRANVTLSVYSALNGAFPYTRIIPGDTCLLLAGLDPSLNSLGPGSLSLRLAQRAISVRLLVPAYLRFRLDEERARWFSGALTGPAPIQNQDRRPSALFYALVYWTRQFNPGLGAALERAGRASPGMVFAVIGAVFMSWLAFCMHRSVRCIRQALVYAVASSGFFGMLATLVLVFSFQLRFGYIYKGIGFLIALFMAGIALGSFVAAKWLSGKRGVYSSLVGVEAAMAAFAVLLYFLCMADVPYSASGLSLVAAAFLATGLLLGFEFPVANHLYLHQDGAVGATSGTLYAADLAGGCVAGLIGAVLLVPLVGLPGCAATLGLLKLSSLAVAGLAGRKGHAGSELSSVKKSKK